MSDTHDAFDPAITEYYNRGKETARLHEGRSQLERLRTQELLLRFLPPAPAIVHDVGGGAGVYALWLAQHGYTVNLLDATPLHVEQAQNASALQPDAPIKTVTLGDARALPFEDASADAVLLFGPLYHLTEHGDRLAALREAHRTLKSGGVVLAASINRFASAFDALFGGYLHDPDFRPVVDRALADGQHRSPDGKRFFTTAYFHRPDELRDEVSAAGFIPEALVGIEGMAWALGDFEAAWADPEAREWVLKITRQLESEPTLLGMSSHLMAVGRKA